MLRAREPTSPGGFRWLRIEPVGTVVSDVRDHVSIAHPSVYFFLSPFVFSRLETDLSRAGELRVEQRGLWRLKAVGFRNGMGLPSCRRWAMGRYWWFLDSRRRLLTRKFWLLGFVGCARVE